jgi:peptide/nickel transport system permease protein
MRQGLIFYVLRRLVAFAAMLVLISFLVFSLLYISPGSAVDILLGDNPRTPELVRALEEQYHLDEPFFTQYWIWAKDALQFQFGESIQTTLPVTDEIGARWTVSVFLGVYAFVITVVLGLLLGIVAALKRGSIVDRAVVALSVAGLSTPVFVSGVALLYVFAIVLPWFPTFGRGEGFFDELYHLTLPALSLALVSAAVITKNTRASMIGVLDQDYVTFARARGLSPTRVLLGYALRNGLIPVVTIAGLLLATLIVGAVLVEVTFSLPGLGGLLVQSATTKDLPMLQGVGMLVAAVIMTANLIVDLVYVVVDPRIRLGARTGT